jgi:hypothetical protein
MFMKGFVIAGLLAVSTVAAWGGSNLPVSAKGKPSVCNGVSVPCKPRPPVCNGISVPCKPAKPTKPGKPVCYSVPSLSPRAIGCPPVNGKPPHCKKGRPCVKPPVAKPPVGCLAIGICPPYYGGGASPGSPGFSGSGSGKNR